VTPVNMAAPRVPAFDDDRIARSTARTMAMEATGPQTAPALVMEPKRAVGRTVGVAAFVIALGAGAALVGTRAWSQRAVPVAPAPVTAAAPDPGKSAAGIVEGPKANQPAPSATAPDAVVELRVATTPEGAAVKENG